MSLYVVVDNGEFLLDDEPGFCTQVNHAESKSKRWDILITDQTADGQDKNDSNPIGSSIGCMLESDDKNLVICGLQTAICATRGFVTVFHALHTP